MRDETGADGQRQSSALLDQVASPRLVRASAAYSPRTMALPAKERTRGVPFARARRVVLATLLPPSMFALAGVMIFGLARGTAGKLAGDGGFSVADAAMVALLLIAGVTVFGQGLAMLRSQAWGRRGIAAAGSHVHRRAGAVASPGAGAPAPVLLLDLVSAERLAAAAPPDLGSGSRTASLARASWRTGDTLLWIILGALSVGVAAFAAVGLGFSVWRAIDQGGFTAGLLVLTVVCAMAFLGLGMMARTTVLAIFDRRRRRRRPAFFRMVRYGAKPLARGDGAGGGRAAAVATAVVTALAVVSIVGASFWPEVSDAIDEVGGDGPGTLAAEPGVTPSPTPTPTTASAVAPTATPTPKATATATIVSVSPTASPAATPTPPPQTATPTAAVVVGTATPSPTQSPTPTAIATPSPTPTPTRTPTPSPTPTPTATPTPTPPPDSDSDGVPDAVEVLYESNPNNDASKPENAAYNPATCSDGLDNDGDGATDTGGLGLAGDPGCLIA